MSQEALARILATLLSLLQANTDDRARIESTIAAVQEMQQEQVVLPGADLQAVIDAAPAGATLRLRPGTVYTGAFTCRRPLTVTTQGATPQGRVAPGAPFATLRSPDTRPTWNVAPGARGCVLEAVTVEKWVQLGIGTETALDQLPIAPVLRQVVIAGQDSRRCVSVNAIDALVELSHISGCRSTNNQDSQAVLINVGQRITVRDNYLEGVSENIMVGGDRVRIPNHVPSEIDIVGNDIVKPLAWKGASGYSSVKNSIELKNARLVRIIGNRISGIWPAAQPGYALTFTPRNQYGDNPWAVVEDVIVERNTIENAAGGFSILGDDNLQPSQRTRRITIRGNRFLLFRSIAGGRGAVALITRGPEQITYEQNTAITDGPYYWDTGGGGTQPKVLGFAARNNLLVHNSTGFRSDLYTPGVATLNGYYPGWVWDGNVIAGGSNYPPGTTIMTPTAFRAEFSDYEKGILKPGSVLAGKGAP